MTDGRGKQARSVRSESCLACPYRQDVPSGIWAYHEYEKLRGYDEPTSDQPMAYFGCHATPEFMCHGWAAVHTSRGNEFDLLALRLWGSPEVPTGNVPLFASGNEAADWGQQDIEEPSEEATRRMEALLAKYPRLQVE